MRSVRLQALLRFRSATRTLTQALAQMAGEWFHDDMTIENHIAIPCDISVRKRNLEMFQKPAWNTHAYGVKKGRKGPRMFIASIPHHAFDISRKSLPFLNIISLRDWTTQLGAARADHLIRRNYWTLSPVMLLDSSLTRDWHVGWRSLVKESRP